MSILSSYSTGKTSRVITTSVREDNFSTNTDSPELLMLYWHEVIAMQPDYEMNKESLIVVMMNAKLHPFAWNRVSIGTANETMAHPREIFRPVICAGAYSFVLMHNHPSGDTDPSDHDKNLTKRIAHAADILQIRFIDHVIIGSAYANMKAFYSFRESGLL